VRDASIRFLGPGLGWDRRFYFGFHIC
jgi:hypothetical protein